MWITTNIETMHTEEGTLKMNRPQRRATTTDNIPNYSILEIISLCLHLSATLLAWFLWPMAKRCHHILQPIRIQIRESIHVPFAIAIAARIHCDWKNPSIEELNYFKLNVFRFVFVICLLCIVLSKTQSRPQTIKWTRGRRSKVFSSVSCISTIPNALTNMLYTKTFYARSYAFVWDSLGLLFLRLLFMFYSKLQVAFCLYTYAYHFFDNFVYYCFCVLLQI